MRVQYVQSGGSVGVTKGADLDMARLPAEDAHELRNLVKESGLSVAHTALSEGSRDLLQHEITIDDGHHKFSVVLDDGTIPPQAKTLVGYLRRRAHPTPPA